MNSAVEEKPMLTVTVKDLWDIFTKRFIYLVLAVIVAGGGFFAFNKLTYVPKYSSTATMYVLCDSSNTQTGNSSPSIYDFNLAMNIVSDCKSMVTSRSVLEMVIGNLSLDTDYTTLKSSIKVDNSTDTRIISVTVEADTPEDARTLVNEICRVCIVRVSHVMNGNQLNQLDLGGLNTEPSNATSLLKYILVAFGAAVLVYFIFFVVFLMDDSLKTDEDIQNYTGVSVIGDIPNAHEKNKHGKYGRYGYKYRGYKRYGYYGHEGTEAEDTGELKDQKADSDKKDSKDNKDKKIKK